MKIVYFWLIVATKAQIEGSAQNEGSADFNDLETCQEGDIAVECNLDSIKIRKINLASTCSGKSPRIFDSFFNSNFSDGVIGRARNYCPIKFTNYTAEITVSDSW